jgi:micrococcal nuclease
MKTKRIIIFLLIVIGLFFLSLIYPKIQNLTGNSVGSYYPSEEAILLRAVDGDTIHALVNGKEETIRLLGINTPEKNMPFYSATKEYLKQFENKSIALKRDIEDTDKYKRKLRYVFYNNQMLNLKIVEKGYASTYYLNNLIYEKDFLAAEKQARNKEVGIWQKSKDDCSSCIILEKLDAKEEYFTIKNICDFSCALEGWFVKDAGRNNFYLASLGADSSKTYNSDKEVWNNDGDSFFMFDKQGLLVIYYSY